MVVLVNRAKVSTGTEGTGTITLGDALSSFQTFAGAGVSDGDVVQYVIEDGINWEIGTGTYTATGTTLTRTVSESSNAGSAINLSGAAVVFVASTAEDFDFRPELRQSKQYEPFNGFDNGTTDTQIFPGSRLPPQGICRLTVSGVEYDFIALRDDSGGSSPERFRIVKYTVGTAANVEFSGILDINHCQDLSGTVSGSNVTLYAQMSDGNGDSKGVSVIDWQGALTAQSDVTAIQLFGSTGSGHRFERYTGATVGVGGGRLILLANDIKSGQDDTGHTYIAYDLAAVIAASTPLDLEPIAGPLPIRIGTGDGQNTLQGCDVLDDHFRLYRGFVNPRQRKLIQFWDFQGNLFNSVEAAVSLNDYTNAQLGEDGTLGAIRTVEPEGLTHDSQGRAVLLTYEEWHDIDDVRSWEGKNFTPRRGSVTSAPSASDDWVETSATADGAWVAGTYTGNGGNYTRRQNVIHVVGAPLASGADKPLGNPAQFVPSNASLVAGSNGTASSVDYGQDYTVSAMLGAVGKARTLFEHGSEFILRLFDAREGSDNTKQSSISVTRRPANSMLNLRAEDALANGAGMQLRGLDGSSRLGEFRLWSTKANQDVVEAMAYSAEDDVWPYLRNIPQTVASTGVKAAVTGTTGEATLATVTIPAGLMGPNGWLRITTNLTMTNNGNNKTFKIKLGGSELTNTTGGVTNSAASNRIITVVNRNDVASQAVHAPSANSTQGETDGASTTLSINSDADMTLLFTGDLADAGDELALEGYTVEICYVA